MKITYLMVTHWTPKSRMNSHCVLYQIVDPPTATMIIVIVSQVLSGSVFLSESSPLWVFALMVGGLRLAKVGNVQISYVTTLHKVIYVYIVYENARRIQRHTKTTIQIHMALRNT